MLSSAMHAPLLIITADDMGYAIERDAGILRAVQAGKVTSASVREGMAGAGA